MIYIKPEKRKEINKAMQEIIRVYKANNMNLEGNIYLLVRYGLKYGEIEGYNIMIEKAFKGKQFDKAFNKFLKAGYVTHSTLFTSIDTFDIDDKYINNFKIIKED